MGGRAGQGGQPSAKRSKKDTKPKDTKAVLNPAAGLNFLPMPNGLENGKNRGDMMEGLSAEDDMALGLLGWDDMDMDSLGLGDFDSLDPSPFSKKAKGKKSAKKSSSKMNEFSGIDPPTGQDLSAALAGIQMLPLPDLDSEPNIMPVEKPSWKVDNKPPLNTKSSFDTAANGSQSPSLGRINSSGSNKSKINKRKDGTQPLGALQPLPAASPNSSPSFARQKSNVSQGEVLNSVGSGGIQPGDAVLNGRLKFAQRSDNDPPIECEFGLEWPTRDALRKEQGEVGKPLSSIQAHSTSSSRPTDGIPHSTLLGMEPGRPAPIGELPDIATLYRRMQMISSSMGVSLSSSDSATVLALALQHHLRNIVTKCVDWANGVRECLSIREKLDRKFGSNQVENKLDADSVTIAHKSRDPFMDSRKGNARASSSVNGKSIHGNFSDHRAPATDVQSSAKGSDKKQSGSKNPSKPRKDTARHLITAKDLMMVAELTGQMLGDEVSMHRERISSLL